MTLEAYTAQGASAEKGIHDWFVCGGQHLPQGSSPVSDGRNGLYCGVGSEDQLCMRGAPWCDCAWPADSCHVTVM